MITVLKFTNLDADEYDFLGTNARVRVFQPHLQPRGSNRPHMQMHGRHARPQLFDGLDIHHEGIVKSGSQSTLTSERSTMLATILGDLSVAPSGTKLGVLTVKYAHWTESASGDVILEDWSAELNYQPGVSLPYMFAWSSPLPYFIGDTSSEPVIL